MARLAAVLAMTLVCLPAGAEDTRQPQSLNANSLYERGLALEREGKNIEAVRMYVRAARGGSVSAAKRLGEIYDKGIDGVSRNYAESLKWGNVARVLGEKTEGGWGCPPNCIRK